MLLLLANQKQRRKIRGRWYWLCALLIVLFNLVLLTTISKYNDHEFVDAQQRNSYLTKQLASLQKHYTQNERKLNSLYSTLSYYTRNSRFGVTGNQPRNATQAQDPGFSWVNYSHEYVFPDRVQLTVEDNNGRHIVVLDEIKAWLVSNDAQLADSYVYDSSVVTANLIATPTCGGTTRQYDYQFRSYYLDDWISYYPDGLLQTGCPPLLFARAEEHLSHGGMSCIVYFFNKDSNIPIAHVTMYQPL